MLWRRTLGVLLAVGLGSTVLAGPETYATRAQNIRAGVLVLDSDIGAGSIGNAAPFAWYNLDKNTKLKPAGWSFVNPNASARLTGYQIARWQAIDPAAGLVGGDQLTKSTAPYWEVLLSQVDDSQLSAYDVLMLAPTSRATLNPSERERLRRFVDAGGVLWVDMGRMPNTSSFDQINGLPLAFRADLRPGTAGMQSDLTQPLMSKPNPLSTRDVELLNGTSRGTQGFTMEQVSLNVRLRRIYKALYDDFAQFQPVTLIGGHSTTGVARIGDGFVVVSMRGAAVKLNATRAGTTNLKFRAEAPSLEADGIAAAKFAVNVVSLSGEFRQSAGGSRKANSTALSVTAPLMQRFTGAAASTDRTPPVFYKGMIFKSEGDRIVAYDANPRQDLDGDGDPDDGVRDFSQGQSLDRLWSSTTMPGPISAPICVEIPQPGIGPVDQVLVIDARGAVYAFSAFDANASTGVIDQSGAPQAQIYRRFASNGPSNGGVAEASVHEGILYVADTATRGAGQQGRIWLLDLATGQYVRGSDRSPYVLGGPNTNVSLPILTTSPTVGYIPIPDGSGGTDKVVYLGFNGADPPQPNQSSGIVSIWVGARGEHPVDVEAASGLQVTTRASQQGGLALREGSMRLHVIDQNGNPWSEAQMSATFQGLPTESDGVITYQFAPGVTQLPANVSVRVDYDIEWSATNSDGLQAVVRGQLNLPDNSTGSRRILGSIAMSPRGTIYAVMSSGTAGTGGSFYAFREEGRGQFRCLARYDLFDRHSILLNQIGRVTYDEVLFDKDPVNQFLPGNQPWGADDRRLRGFVFVGGPTVRNGQVFVTAKASKIITVNGSFKVPMASTILMAFRAEPEAAEFKVGDIPDGTILIQPDITRSSDRTQPEQQSVIQSGAYSYDASRGTIRIENLMNVERGPVQNCLSLSQPVILRRPNSPDQLIDPNAIAGNWSPLLWFTVVQGMDQPAGSTEPFNAAPVVLGNTVYMSGQSVIPDILNGTYNPSVNPIPKSVGMLTAFDAEVSSNDSWLHANDEVTGTNAPYRAWQKQLWSVSFAGGLASDPHQRWPQNKGVTDISDYVVRLNQTTIPGSPTAWGVVGGDNTLVAWSPIGITAFAQSNTVVCDEGRVGVYDGSGNIVFSTTGNASTGENNEGSAAAVLPLVRPTRAYDLGGGSLLIVDTGGNRIVRTSSDGVETRSIRKFFLDPNYIPSGYATNEALTFNGPRDVLTYSGFVFKGEVDQVSNQQNVEYWVHYLVADGGNKRLVELIDRYNVDPTSRRILNPVTVSMDDPTTTAVDVRAVPQLGVLLWHSPALVSGGTFEYNTVSRVYVPASGSSAGRFVYVAGVGGSLPTRSNIGLDTTGVTTPVSSRSGNGGVVVFDPLNPAGSQVISKISLPDVSALKFWDDTQNQFRVTTDPTLLARRAGGVRYLSGVNSVTAKLSSDGTVRLMIADGNGVFEVSLPESTSDTADVSWMMNAETYRVLRRPKNDAGPPLGGNPLGFRPMYAQRLDSGEILIVNGYVGKKRDGNSFTGEVIQLDGSPLELTTNLGFSLLNIRSELSTVSGARNLIGPVFATRR